MCFEQARLQRRKELFEKIGGYSLTISGIIAFSFIIFLAVTYKMILLGPWVLFWSGFGALIGFLVLSIFFFNYPKFFMKPERMTDVRHGANAPEIAATTKLIDNPPFEPVPSVTEDSTDLLLEPRDQQNR